MVKVKYSIRAAEKILATDRDDKFLYVKYSSEWVRIPLKYSDEETPGAVVEVKEISVIDENGKTLRRVPVEDLLKEHPVGDYLESGEVKL